MKFYNVHAVHQDKLQGLLNTHAEKGYEVRWFRNTGGPNVQVVFEQAAKAREKRLATTASNAFPVPDSKRRKPGVEVGCGHTTCLDCYEPALT